MSALDLQLPADLAPLGERLDPGTPGLVYAAPPPADWPDVERALVDCFRLTRAAAGR
ncbi:MAG: hypothetical protein IRY97_07735, partial [Thermomicrobiaceae bacterium]|nr:hypothetical protein [Thermomicrobiaceae bacterium]